MCEILYKGEGQTGSDYIFAHAFLTMEWNLMARSDNCLHMHMSHVQWYGNSLLFFFGKSKGNQAGEHSSEPWHVYANPQNPMICPVLALSKYLLSNPDVMTDSSKLLFPGAHQYDRFIRIFNKVIDTNIDQFRVLGVEKKALGTHSACKGSITLVSSGCTVSPHISSICLRACWSMGPVKDRYIHYEKAGDQFCGRCATGLSSLTKEFAISPAYWDWSRNVEEDWKLKVDQLIEHNLVEKKRVPATMFELIRFMFASIVYYYDHLDENLHADSKLCGSPLFSAAGNDSLRNLAVVSYPWNATEHTPTFSGIPPHVLLLNDIESLKIRMKQQTKDVVEGIVREFDKRRVGGDRYEVSVLLEEIKKNNKEMLDRLENIGTGVSSHLPPSEGATEDNIDNEFVYIDNEEEDNDIRGSGSEDEEEVCDNTPKRRGGVILSWKNISSGKLRLLPKNYVIPSLSLSNMLTMWFCGDTTKNIPPYKMLKACDVEHIKGEK